MISCKIGGQSFRALIDSGAQLSLMNKHAVERCGYGNRIDSRCPSVAVGVGIQNIIGHIPSVNVKIGRGQFPNGFGILENLKLEVILGSDFLTTYGCVLNFEDSFILIGENKLKAKFLK